MLKAALLLREKCFSNQIFNVVFLSIQLYILKNTIFLSTCKSMKTEF